VTDADDMVYITESKFQELVRKDAACVREAEQTVIRKDSPQSHGPGMQYGLIAQATKAGMAVHYLDALANDDVAEDGKEGEDGWERGLAIDDQEWNVVDFEAIREVSYACSARIGVGNHNHLVASINEFLGVVRISE
jgi:hypothetical protein